MPLEFYEYANKVHPELGRASYKQLDDGSRFELIGFLVPDELAWRSVGESWVFLARRQITRRGFRTPIITTGFVRAGRIGRQEMEKRIPELIGLKSQTVAVVGLGCVGAPSVVELARAGLGGVKIMDPDIVEAGTTVRWPFGLQAAGIPKTEFLANFIATNYPYTEVQGWTCRMGGIPGEGGATQEEYEQFCNHTNLIMDASAEIGINELLSEIAREKKIPYVGLSSTFGGWGGRVIVLRPELSACYHCLMHHIEDKTIPLPPESPHGLIQVAGCSDPTFTAAGFDTSEISLSAVRCVVSVLCAGAEGAYPKIEGDVFILRLRNENGTSCLPHWEAYKLARHPKCQNH
jgi:molybdopterin/thiamine biosynthesis adenylyltransferase